LLHPLTAAPGRLRLAPAGGLEMETRDETLLRIGIAAALAGGSCDERERRHLDELARAAGVSTSVALVQRAELPTDLRTRLGTPEGRRAAYDLAVAVCHADGAANDAERRFLADLRGLLGIDESQASDA